MLTKVLAAKRAARSGATRSSPRAARPTCCCALRAAKRIGTLLIAAHAPLAARKQWLADHLQMRGRVASTTGAALKLRDGGKSLLPIGVRRVSGEFQRGDVIAVRTRRARGGARPGELRPQPRRGSSCASRRREIEAILGYVDEPELIHRDNLVLV